MSDPFDLICPFCLLPFIDKDLPKANRLSKIFSDGSGFIIFYCKNCGQELESQIILSPPIFTENFKPTERII